MSPSDAVDGSSTGARAPRKWRLLRLPRVGGAKACRRSQQLVSISPRDDGVTRLVVKRIIDAARSGERDPERLVRRGLQERSSGS